MGDGRPPSAREMGVKGHRNCNSERTDGRWESRATETATVKGQMGAGRPPSAREMGVKGHRNHNRWEKKHSKRTDGRSYALQKLSALTAMLFNIAKISSYE
jgi:hypothetical protein